MAKYGQYDSPDDHLTAVLYWNTNGNLDESAARECAKAVIASGWTLPPLAYPYEVHACAKCGHTARQHPVPGHCEWWTDSTRTDPRKGDPEAHIQHGGAL
jgi:hypothetical protein